MCRPVQAFWFQNTYNLNVYNVLSAAQMPDKADIVAPIPTLRDQEPQLLVFQYYYILHKYAFLHPLLYKSLHLLLSTNQMYDLQVLFGFRFVRNCYWYMFVALYLLLYRSPELQLSMCPMYECMLHIV